MLSKFGLALLKSPFVYCMLQWAWKECQRHPPIDYLECSGIVRSKDEWLNFWLKATEFDLCTLTVRSWTGSPKEYIERTVGYIKPRSISVDTLRQDIGSRKLPVIKLQNDLYLWDISRYTTESEDINILSKLRERYFSGKLACA